ncbi:BamA/TamA family outer membrane protein [Candidatus Poribacteria bacterium]|nr:BamA/TamA family outer membrane protein [Candidatus Poribacteria bacterium]
MIYFNGNKELSDKKLEQLISIQPGEKFDPQILNTRISKILNEYKKLGYMFARIQWEIRPAERDQIAIIIEIEEGNTIKTGKIRISGNEVIPSRELLNELNMPEGRIFTESAFKEGMNRILALYAIKGYPLAKLITSDFRVQDDMLNMNITVEEGSLTRIGEIKIQGLKKTKEMVILRKININTGDIFNQDKIDESKRKLNNTGYFRSVGVKFEPMYLDNDNNEDYPVILTFQVEEARTGQFNGLFGYNPSENDSEARKFTGLLEASESNLLGTGRHLAIKGKVGIINSYDFLYREPWIFGKPLDLGIRIWGVNQETQSDTERFIEIDGESPIQDFRPETYLPETQQIISKERAVSIDLTADISNYIKAVTTLTYKLIDSPVINTEIQQDSTDEILSGQRYGITFTLERDSRDYFANPSSGRFDSISTELSSGISKTLKIWFDSNQYFSIRKNQVLTSGLHGARILGDSIPLTEMLYLGGANSLRGYSENFFRGTGTLLLNNEYRFIVSRDSHFFIFIDLGTVYNNEDGFELLKLGYGLGMRLRSTVGLVNVDYGLASGDSALNGKIHISLGAAF